MSDSLYVKLKEVFTRDTNKISRKEVCIRIFAGVILIAFSACFSAISSTNDIVAYMNDWLHFTDNPIWEPILSWLTGVVPMVIGMVILSKLIPAKKPRNLIIKIIVIWFLAITCLMTLAVILLATNVI